MDLLPFGHLVVLHTFQVKYCALLVGAIALVVRGLLDVHLGSGCGIVVVNTGARKRLTGGKMRQEDSRTSVSLNTCAVAALAAMVEQFGGT